MAGMRFPMPMPISPDEGLEMDEHGNINWHHAWLKEIGHLQQVTQEQEKAGADQEWFRMMLFKVRSALMPSHAFGAPMETLQMPPHMIPGSYHGGSRSDTGNTTGAVGRESFFIKFYSCSLSLWICFLSFLLNSIVQLIVVSVLWILDSIEHIGRKESEIRRL